MVEITGVVEMTNMIAFCAEGALILTSTRSGAAHFTSPCNKVFLWYWVGAVFHMPKAYFTRAAYFTLLTDFSMRPTSSGLVEMTGEGGRRQRHGKGTVKVRQRHGKGTAKARQRHGKGTAKARQRHGKGMANGSAGARFIFLLRSRKKGDIIKSDQMLSRENICRTSPNL